MNLDVPEKFEKFEMNCGIGGSYEVKCPLVKTSKALNDLIIIEIIEQDKNRLQRGGIHLPEVHTSNFDLMKGKILSVGPKAEKYNVKNGDIVLYDKASAHFHPPEKVGTLIITNVENIICVIKD